MYPLAFPLHWIKGTFYTLNYFVGLIKMVLGGPCDLKWLGKEHIVEGGDFLVGKDTPKDTMLIKQGSLCNLQGLTNKVFLDGCR